MARDEPILVLDQGAASTRAIVFDAPPRRRGPPREAAFSWLRRSPVSARHVGPARARRSIRCASGSATRSPPCEPTAPRRKACASTAAWRATADSASALPTSLGCRSKFRRSRRRRRSSPPIRRAAGGVAEGAAPAAESWRAETRLELRLDGARREEERALWADAVLRVRAAAPHSSSFG